jgi:hypothetical protein
VRRIVVLLTVVTMLVVMLVVTGGVAAAHVSVGGVSVDTGGSSHVHMGCSPWDPRGC